MGKIEECEQEIRKHDYQLGKAKDGASGVTLTADEVTSLLDYLEVWFPENLKQDDWDSLQWLYNVLNVWKKCKAAAEPSKPPSAREVFGTKEETFF